MFYTSQPEELREFLRDKLDLPWADVGEGWLIFKTPEVELGCHPQARANGRPAGTHSISFYCDDLRRTVQRLRARGVKFTDRITDAGFGLLIHFKLPGGVAAELYQPKYVKRFRTRSRGKQRR
jgi:hypothetical protein